MAQAWRVFHLEREQLIREQWQYCRDTDADLTGASGFSYYAPALSGLRFQRGSTGRKYADVGYLRKL